PLPLAAAPWRFPGTALRDCRCYQIRGRPAFSHSRDGQSWRGDRGGSGRIVAPPGGKRKQHRAAVRATMETIELGESESGAVAHAEKLASQADGIIIFGRVKTHPQNVEGIASGLLKMTTVGL